MKQEFGKVGVLFGGRSAEREISIMSGTGVLSALQSRGINAHKFYPAEHSLADLASEKFDRVFIALHGRYGEDGTLQAKACFNAGRLIFQSTKTDLIKECVRE
jgi:D-alanine-D-alanine ligase